MATSGDVEEVPEPGMDHPAEPCMGVDLGGDQLAPMTEEISFPLAADMTSDHHEAAQLEHSAETSTSKSEPEEVAAKTTSDDHCEAAALIPKHAADGSSTASEEEVPVLSPVAKEQQEAAEDDGQAESARERLKRHRREMAGRVWVPDMWGQEKLLKDWVDCAVFDRPLVPPDLLTARRALVAECCTRRPDRTTTPAGSSPLRVQNSCS
uniref:Protein BIC1 n=1 Tax=Oryza punctata TaxID=4537 RepID=A0A0E0KQA3_ORYPU